MGVNLKEKFQNVSKKNIAIISAILIAILICIVGGVEYYQYHNFKEKAQNEAAQNYEEELPIDLSAEPKKPSEYKIGIEYNKAMKGNKPVLALFYADWCHYCIKFMPVYEKLYEKYNKDIEFAKVNVEDKKYEKIVNEIGITGFPTVFILDPKYDNKVLLSNSYLGSVKQVSSELDRFLRIRKILDSKKK